MGNCQKQPFQHWKLTKGMEQMEKHLFKKIYKTLVRMVGIYGLLARSCCHIPLSYIEQQFHRARQAVRTCYITARGGRLEWEQHLEKYVLGALSK